jgi:hypothetical protein
MMFANHVVEIIIKRTRFLVNNDHSFFFRRSTITRKFVSVIIKLSVSIGKVNLIKTRNSCLVPIILLFIEPNRKLISFEIKQKLSSQLSNLPTNRRNRERETGATTEPIYKISNTQLNNRKAHKTADLNMASKWRPTFNLNEVTSIKLLHKSSKSPRRVESRVLKFHPNNTCNC